MKLRVLTVSLLITAAVWAQPPQERGPRDPQQMLEQRVERISGMLSLTDSQKSRATTIFGDAARTAQPLREQLRDARNSLQTAVRANDVAQIDKLAATIGTLTAQTTAIESKAEAQFITTLTPEQVSKLPEGMGLLGGPGGPGGPGEGRRGPPRQ